jgi:excisionase family DNA binding protein
MEQEYFTPGEIARRLRVKDTTVRRWIRTGILEAETIHQGKPKRHRIKRAIIETIETPSPTIPSGSYEATLCTLEDFLQTRII